MTQTDEYGREYVVRYVITHLNEGRSAYACAGSTRAEYARDSGECATIPDTLIRWNAILTLLCCRARKGCAYEPNSLTTN